MSNYQAVYDAAREGLDFSRQREQATEQIYVVATAMVRPSVLMRPSLVVDGDQWSALYGPNIQEGVCGFGPSPEAAMADFDRAWTTSLSATRRVKTTDRGRLG